MLANHLGEGRISALSAGSQPTGRVHPRALAVLERHGIPVAEPSSDSWERFAEQKIDLVITVCDSAAGESCPLWMGDVPKVHWGVADPAKAEGTEDEIEAAFEATYEAMRQRIEQLVGLELALLTPKQVASACQDIHASV